MPDGAMVRGLMIAGLEFGKLTNRSVVDAATEPRRIFAALPAALRKRSAAGCAEPVWDRWHDRRMWSDLLVKMNTGGGKAVARVDDAQELPQQVV